MHDTLNKLKLQLDSLMNTISDDLKDSINEIIDSIVEQEISRVKNMAMLQCRAYMLRKGDLILDYSDKSITEITYAAKRTECQFNVPKENTEILVMYREDNPCDYFMPDDQVTILIDITEIINKNKCTLDGMDEDI